jgi:stage V sporulation protein B
MARGIFYYFLSTLTFILCGYAIHIGLGRILGPAQYGIFGVVVSLSTISYVFFNNGIQSAISKYISEKGASAYPIFRTAIKSQLVFGISITLIWIVLADVIAGWLNDLSLAIFIRFSALAVLPLALYEVHLGFLNGTKAFGRHAFAVIVYSLSKLVGVFLFVYLGFQVKGAIAGYIAGAVCALVVTRILSRFQLVQGSFGYRKLIWFAMPVMMSGVATSLLMNIDLLFVKSILKDNDLAGFYTSASNIARPIWFLSTAVGATLLPWISQASSAKDKTMTKEYINKSLRYVLIILLPLTVIISASAQDLIQLLYSKRFVPASGALQILVFGFLCLSVFTILCTVITGTGKPMTAMVLIFTIIPVDIILNFSLIPRYQLLGAAWATTLSCLIGMLLNAFYVYKTFNAYLNLISLFKISFASAVVYITLIAFEPKGLFSIINIVCALALYLVLLFGLKEVDRKDLLSLKAIFPRKTAV